MRRKNSFADVLAIEVLESRNFLSAATPFLNLECLPSRPLPGTPVPAPSTGPTPGQPSSGGNPQSGQPGTPQPHTIPVSPVGQWTGTHTPDGNAQDRALSILIQSPTADTYSARLTFAGVESFSINAPFRYDAKTGKFSLYFLSTNLVVRLQGQYNTDTGAIEGIVQYATRTRGFLGSFTATLPT